MAAIFQAEVWCDDCAEKLRDRLWKDSPRWATFASRVDWEAAFGFIDEHLYDSCEYPKDHPDSEVSDSPTHCRGCEKFLENDLTKDGANYVIEAVRDDLAAGHPDSTACTIWRKYYSWLDFSSCG